MVIFATWGGMGFIPAIFDRKKTAKKPKFGTGEILTKYEKVIAFLCQQS